MRLFTITVSIALQAPGRCIFAFFAIVTLGSLIAEYTSRKKVTPDALEKLICSISRAASSQELMDVIKNARLYENQKVILVKILRADSLTADTRETLARKLIEFEETKRAKTIERTDIVTRIGPTLGLMGTLIPMGPGLAALGAGDVNTLANAIIVAFDTTVVGIGAGAVGYFVSKIRRRWYEEDLSNLDALCDALLDKLKH